jgi:hypothetical protein
MPWTPFRREPASRTRWSWNSAAPAVCSGESPCRVSGMRWPPTSGSSRTCWTDRLSAHGRPSLSTARRVHHQAHRFDPGGDVSSRPRMTLTATVLDAPDARLLADFYQRLLGWPIGRDEPDWVTLRPPGSGAGLSFQAETAYVRPTWPAGPSDQQMMMQAKSARGSGAGPLRPRSGGVPAAPALNADTDRRPHQSRRDHRARQPRWRRGATPAAGRAAGIPCG